MAIEHATSPEPTPPAVGLFAPLRVRNFRLLWVGIGVSGIGDQFSYVALPWLALQLTDDPLFVGLVRTMTGIALMLFMLVGGAVTDRFAPRPMMVLSNAALAVLALAVALLVWGNLMTGWLLLAFAFLFGMGGAFFEPAYHATLPRLLPKDHLAPGNALMTMTFQLGGSVGPGVAGIVVAALGVGVAFGFNALTFAVAVVALLLMRGMQRPAPTESTDDDVSSGLFASITDGLRYAVREPQLRALLVLIFLINGALNPALGVGLAVAADGRYGGAGALGLLMSSIALGALAGTTLAGTNALPKALGLMLAAVSALLGLSLLGLAFAPSLWAALACTATVGLGIGVTNVRVMTWIQHRVPAERMGRFSSLMMFGAVGLQPIGFALAGAVSRDSLTVLFVGCGALLLLMAAWTITSAPIRTMQAV